MARDGNKSSDSVAKGQANTKKEGPVPISEIDPNAVNQKRRKAEKLSENKPDEKI